jgi:hypothetical protein
MIFAHAGHWIADSLYAPPVLLVLAALGVQALRDRRKRRGEQENGKTRRNI